MLTLSKDYDYYKYLLLTHIYSLCGVGMSFFIVR
jgi:hypothetical protein